MFIYLSKKIAIPNNTRIQCLDWNKEHGYIACGGDNGLLKVLKLEIEKDGKVKGFSAPSNLSMNQTLEGHTGVVQVVTWNTQFQKLTSSDENGLIIVWMLYKGSWYEEMINNRNKSVVRGMAWNADGQKICIVYDDGAVIVGSVDGNRIWGKELKNLHLSLVAWSPDGRFLLFGMQNGEVHVFEQGGNPVSKVALPVLQSSNTTNLIGIQWYSGSSGSSEPGRAALAIGYDSGKIQLMYNESDDSPLILDVDMTATCMQWNHDGTMLAVTGKLLTGDAEKKNVVKFFSPYGQYLYTLRVPGRDIRACAWEGSGLRIALAVDSFIFFANIRPDYKWCYFANTVAYAFHRKSNDENTVMFWNVETNEKHMKPMKHLQRIVAAGDFCAVARKGENGQFVISICNSIGIPVDSCTTDIEPLFLAANESHVFAASRDHVFVWHFQTPRDKTMLELSTQRNKTGQERVLHVNDTPAGGEGAFDADRVYEHKRKYQINMDPICCITVSDKICVVGRESGTFQHYSLPHMAFVQKYSVSCRPSKIALNCNSARMSIIDILGNLIMYDLEAISGTSPAKELRGEQLQFERRDVWDVKWAKDNSELFAVMEKTRMYVFRNTDPEEPVMLSGYICSFSNLEVKAVHLDDIMEDPENPTLDQICNLEVKTLRDSRDLISKVGMEEAIQFIEDNSHPRLWQLLAEAALQKMDFETAEIAFVRSKNYQGIQFVKYISKLPNEDIKKAEVAAYFRQFDEAKKIYLDIDRSPEDCCCVS